MEEIEVKTENLLKDNRGKVLAISVLFLGLFVLALGLGIYYFENNKGEDIKIISASSSQLPTAEIVVDVEGAVNSPGLYKLQYDSRVSDVLEKAGGLSSDADKNKINLAAKVTDGQKLVIAMVGDFNQQTTGNKQQTTIGINSATAAELDTLPGVGQATANKIIAARPYSNINELVSKKAVSSSVFEKIKDLISTD